MPGATDGRCLLFRSTGIQSRVTGFGDPVLSVSGPLTLFLQPQLGLPRSKKLVKFDGQITQKLLDISNYFKAQSIPEEAEEVQDPRW